MNFGSTFVALETSGRLFGLDYQLLFDAAITAINVFILFLLLSVILFNPVRNMLKKRQDKITSDRETAEKNREDALAMKAEYEEKLKAANKEAELILSDARKTAMHNEQKIIDEAKEEAARIIERAGKEAELEKQKVADNDTITLRICNWEEYIDEGGWNADETIDLLAICLIIPLNKIINHRIITPDICALKVYCFISVR